VILTNLCCASFNSGDNCCSGNYGRAQPLAGQVAKKRSTVFSQGSESRYEMNVERNVEQDVDEGYRHGDTDKGIRKRMFLQLLLDLACCGSVMVR